MLQLCPVRIAAMCRLYEMQKNGPTDRKFQNQIDTALNLALGEQRAADNVDYLCRNLLRDARRTTSRSRASNRAAAAGRPLADARHRRLVEHRNDGSVQAELITFETPEEQVIANEIVARLRNFAESIGHHGPSCLQGMLEGETVAATASSAGVSVATVERARRALRDFTESLIEPQ
ncbi:hypothetical protein [Streptomyces rubiginosohelvolus]|uniref:hypothetical protein n=1 Tax=Streptomyces rubiginosohelvolus TaxID=67362 RepID=UPI0035D6B943